MTYKIAELLSGSLNRMASFLAVVEDGEVVVVACDQQELSGETYRIESKARQPRGGQRSSRSAESYATCFIISGEVLSLDSLH